MSKRTPMEPRRASGLPASRKSAGGTGAWRKRAAITVAIVLGGALLFVAGRETVGVPWHVQQEFDALRLEIRLQQREVDRLTRSSEQSVNALAARLAELQAASTRLDALGERLARMGQLTLDEFDFSEPAPVGGPAEGAVPQAGGADDLRRAIATLGDRLRRQSSQLDTLQFLMMNRQLDHELTPAGWPVRKGWISSRYGERNDPFTGEKTRHAGLDFAGTRGTEVLSVASGVVIRAGSRAGYGQTVEIDHGNGYRTRYAHNEGVMVEPGEHVTAGQVIARMGSSGRSSAPHVHFEVLRDGKRVNPSSFVAQLR